MTPYEREELRRAKDWQGRGMKYLADENYELATECFSIAQEHMASAMMTTEQLSQHLACRIYETGNLQITKGI